MFEDTVIQKHDSYIVNCINSCKYIKLDKRIFIWIILLLIYASIFVTFELFKIPLKSKSNSILLKSFKHPDNHVFSNMLQKKADNVAKKSFLNDDKSSKNDVVSTLTNIFYKADMDKDGFLDTTEMITWIGERIHQHLTRAVKENILIFTAIDIHPRNGFVSWEEFLRYFFKNRGYDEHFAEAHFSSLKGLSRNIKESLMRYKAAFSEASRQDATRLSLDEFLAFRHPESSAATVIARADAFIDKFDNDGDDRISLAEFSDDSISAPFDSQSINDNDEDLTDKRRKEFEQNIDEDKDGFATKKEVIAYLNPKNAAHAIRETQSLLRLGDENKDGRLSLVEILANKDLFVVSKMVDVAASFHDEF